MNRIFYFAAAAAVALFCACNGTGNSASEETTKDTTATDPAAMIDADGLADHIQMLASDEFLGRKPFTEGETKTINYIREQYQKIGLQPGNGDSYFQQVPLVDIRIDTMSDMVIKGGKSSLKLSYKNDFVAATRRVTEKIEINNSPMVFAGFGVVAPEYGWNDYNGLDVKGKTVVVLVNDPGYGKGNEDIFNDEAMTYYGRWTYKYEEAARQGAEAIIIIHDAEPASYPWSVVEKSNTGSELHLQSANDNMDRCKMEGWITMDAAKKLFAAAVRPGYDFTAKARQREFKPFPLNLNMSLSFRNSFKKSTSNNVIGILKGSTRPEETIIYTAHWDHFGVGSAVDGDSIYNGAVDNATGVAALFEIAQAFSAMEPKPERSIIFLAVTAEEQGLLGSEWYSKNPLYAPEKTVANINMDAFHPKGETVDFNIIGYGQSQLDDYAKEVAEMQGREISPDKAPERGSFYRSDHFNFAKIGIPALYAKGGTARDTSTNSAFSRDYGKLHYHQPSDEFVREEWDLSGMLQDLRLLFLVGKRLSNETTFPEYKEGSEFRAIRFGE